MRHELLSLRQLGERQTGSLLCLYAAFEDKKGSTPMARKNSDSTLLIRFNNGEIEYSSGDQESFRRTASKTQQYTQSPVCIGEARCDIASNSAFAPLERPVHPWF